MAAAFAVAAGVISALPAAARDRGLDHLEKALKGPAKDLSKKATGRVVVVDFSSSGDPGLSSEFGQAVAESLTTLLVRRQKKRFNVVDRRELIKAMHDSAVYGEAGSVAKTLASGTGAEVLVSGTYAAADSRVALHIKATSTKDGRLLGSHTAYVPLTPDLTKMMTRSFRLIGTDPGPAPPSGPEMLEVDAGIYYEGGNGKLYPLRDGMVLTSRDNYAIHLAAPQDCFIYVYQADSSGKTTRLFPNESFSAAANPVPAGSAFWVPGGNGMLFLDENPGKEEIFIFATKNAAPGLAAVEQANLSDIHRVIRTMGVAGVRRDLAIEKVAKGTRTSMESVIRRLAAAGDFYHRVSFFHQD